MRIPLHRPAASSLTTYGRYFRGEVLQVDTGSNAEAVKVLRCTGDYPGPFQLAVRPVTWLDRTWWWLQRYPRHAKRAVREWWLSRCEQRSCWRKEAIVDTDWQGWCAKHADGKEKRHDA